MSPGASWPGASRPGPSLARASGPCPARGLGESSCRSPPRLVPPLRGRVPALRRTSPGFGGTTWPRPPPQRAAAPRRAPRSGKALSLPSLHLQARERQHVVEARLDSIERVETVTLGQRRADDHRPHDLGAIRRPAGREEVERVALSGIEADMQAASARVHIVGPFFAFFSRRRVRRCREETAWRCHATPYLVEHLLMLGDLTGSVATLPTVEIALAILGLVGTLGGV